MPRESSRLTKRTMALRRASSRATRAAFKCFARGSWTPDQGGRPSHPAVPSPAKLPHRSGRHHREGVAYVWLVSPTLRTVELFRRADIGWLLVGVHRGDAVVRAEPFDAVPLTLAGLWAV